jgi:hypothetical protein
VANKHLLAALAAQGVTEEDYAKIRRARRIIDEVNAALIARGAPVTCAVTMLATGHLQTGPSREITEDHAG